MEGHYEDENDYDYYDDSYEPPAADNLTYSRPINNEEQLFVQATSIPNETFEFKANSPAFGDTNQYGTFVAEPRRSTSPNRNRNLSRSRNANDVVYQDEDEPSSTRMPLRTQAAAAAAAKQPKKKKTKHDDKAFDPRQIFHDSYEQPRQPNKTFRPDQIYQDSFEQPRPQRPSRAPASNRVIPTAQDYRDENETRWIGRPIGSERPRKPLGAYPMNDEDQFTTPAPRRSTNQTFDRRQTTASPTDVANGTFDASDYLNVNESMSGHVYYDPNATYNENEEENRTYNENEVANGTFDGSNRANANGTFDTSPRSKNLNSTYNENEMANGTFDRQNANGTFDTSPRSANLNSTYNENEVANGTFDSSNRANATFDANDLINGTVDTNKPDEFYKQQMLTMLRSPLEYTIDEFKKASCVLFNNINVGEMIMENDKYKIGILKWALSEPADSSILELIDMPPRYTEIDDDEFKVQDPYEVSIY